MFIRNSRASKTIPSAWKMSIAWVSLCIWTAFDVWGTCICPMMSEVRLVCYTAVISVITQYKTALLQTKVRRAAFTKKNIFSPSIIQKVNVARQTKNRAYQREFCSYVVLVPKEQAEKSIWCKAHTLWDFSREGKRSWGQVKRGGGGWGIVPIKVLQKEAPPRSLTRFPFTYYLDRNAKAFMSKWVEIVPHS